MAQLNAGSLLEPGWDERREIIVTWLDHHHSGLVLDIAWPRRPAT